MSTDKGNYCALIRPTLKAGSSIGIVSPSSWDDSSGAIYVEALKSFWKSVGHNCHVHPQNYLKDGLLAGTHKQRAEAFMEMATDPAIGAIMFTRGCAGAIHLLDLLDYPLIAKNPKPIIGFSDTTPLLHAITKQSRLVTFYGPMGYNFAQPTNDQRTCDDLLMAINDNQNSYEKVYPSAICLQEGEAEGFLIGGHLNRMQLTLGTPYDCLHKVYDKENIILFIETVETTRMEIDHLLSHLRLAGKFKNVRGVIIGEMLDIQDGETSLARAGERSYGYGLREIVAKHINIFGQDVPIVENFPCGHGPYISTLPIGRRVKLSVSHELGTSLYYM